MTYIVDKIIFSLCLLYVIGGSKCEVQDKPLSSKIGIVSLEDVTEELSTNWETVATATEGNWETEATTEGNWVTEATTEGNWVTEATTEDHWETAATATEENWVTEATTEENWDTVAPSTEDSTETTTAAPIHSECGGIIELRGGELAVIEYKLRENYNNNEQCIWTIRNHHYSPTELRTLQFRKTESNFELDFDYLQISSFEKNSYTGPTQSDKVGKVNGLEVLNFTGPVVFVVFSSDSSDVGTGFRIEISTEGDQEYNYEVINFFSNAVNGSGSLMPYFNNLFATFVVSHEGLSHLYLHISYRLDYPAIDYIRVYRVERNGGVIRFSLLEWLDNVGGRWYILSDYTSLVFILESNASNLGDGIEFSWFDSISAKNN